MRYTSITNIVDLIQRQKPDIALIQSVALSLSITVLGTGSSMFARVLVARLTGAETYGIYMYAFSWVNALSFVGAFGLDNASLRFVSDYVGQGQWSYLKGYFHYSHLYTLLISGLLGVLLMLGTSMAHQYISEDLSTTMWVVGLALPLTSLLVVQSKWLLAFRKIFMAQAPLLFFRPIFQIIFIVVLIVILKMPDSASYIMLLLGVSTLLMVLLSTVYLWHIFPDKAKAAAPRFKDREWNKTSINLAVMTIYNTLISRIDVIVVGLFVGTTDAGIYATVATLISLIDFGLNAVNSILAPRFSELYSQGRIAELQQVALQGARLGIAYSFGTSVVMVLGGNFLLRIFGAEFTRGYVPLMILIIGKLVNSFAGSVGYLLTMTDYEDVAQGILGSTAVISVILYFVLVPLFGTIGAALASSSVLILWNVRMYSQVVKLVKIHPSIF